MLQQEAKVIELKYAAKRFGIMVEDELDLAMNALLVKVSVITGWSPPAASFIDELIKQLCLKARESWQYLNMEEVEYAFRQKTIDIKDWGKVISVALITDVITPYLDNRYDLSHQEERIRMPKLALTNGEEEPKKELSPEEWEDWLEDISKETSFLKIPQVSYDYLVRSGKINLSKEEKFSLMDRAIKFMSDTIDINSRPGVEFIKMKREGRYSAEVTATLITNSKRMAVFDYFTTLNKQYHD